MNSTNFQTESPQETLVDIRKLKTVANYAKIVGKTPATIYNWADERKIKMVEIDGNKFIEPRSSDPLN